MADRRVGRSNPTEEESLVQSRLKGAAAIAAVAVTCFATIGCGGNNDSGAPAKAASTTPAVTGTTPVGQRTIGIIGNTFTSEILKRLADDEKATVEAVGWKAIVVDGQATPDGWNSGFDSLIAKKVDAILVGAIEAAPVQKQLDRAKKAGIPVFATALDVFPDSAKHMIVVGES